MKKQIFTIPNLLSVFRLILAFLFLDIYLKWGMEEKQGILIGILLASAISDFLDGKIARRFHMVSEVGKILDPIADKVTQGVLLMCLFSRYRLVKAVFVLFIIKESYMAIMGTRTIIKTHKNEGAKWYGKVSTAAFYVVMVLLILFPGIPYTAANILIGISGGFMLLSFIMYACQYRKIMKENDDDNPRS